MITGAAARHSVQQPLIVWCASFLAGYKNKFPLGRAYNEDGSLTLSATEDSSSAFSINPLGSLNNKTKDIRAKVITNNVLEVKFPFIKGLSYKLNTGFTYQTAPIRIIKVWIPTKELVLMAY